MQKIIPHFWYDTEAKEAAEFYTGLFDNSKIDAVTSIKDPFSKDCDMVSFTLEGQKFMSISAGPFFKFNPSISLFVTFDSEAEIDKVWKALSEGGKVLMPYNTYPWATKYGWLQDKYGLSWQLSMSEHHKMAQKITPLLMFTQGMAGKAKEAIELYASTFPDSKIEMMVPYEKGEGDVEGYLKHARFIVDGFNLMAMDSSGPHEFVFNEAFSLLVLCDTQEEMDDYFNKLSADPESEQCGWLKDKYGVSWQITPKVMREMLEKGTKEQVDRVTVAFQKMKRLDLAEIHKAYDGK